MPGGHCAHCHWPTPRPAPSTAPERPGPARPGTGPTHSHRHWTGLPDTGTAIAAPAPPRCRSRLRAVDHRPHLPPQVSRFSVPGGDPQLLRSASVARVMRSDAATYMRHHTYQQVVFNLHGTHAGALLCCTLRSDCQMRVRSACTRRRSCPGCTCRTTRLRPALPSCCCRFDLCLAARAA